MKKRKQIELGDKVKDPITGISGIAVGRTIWLHGCDRIIVQPVGHDKDHKAFEGLNVDEPQLELITPKKVKKGRKDIGGPVLYKIEKK